MKLIHSPLGILPKKMHLKASGAIWLLRAKTYQSTDSRLCTSPPVPDAKYQLHIPSHAPKATM